MIEHEKKTHDMDGNSDMASACSFFASMAPSSAQGEITVMTDYPAPISTYVFEKNFADVALNDSMNIDIPFRMPKGTPQGYNTTIDFMCCVVVNSADPDRIISINYTFFSNDNYLHSIRHDFVGALNGTFSGSYPTQNINKPETLKVGDNNLRIRVMINAMAKNPGKCHFRLEINNVHVRVKALDLDEDGILDPVDPFLGLNNYTGLSVFSIAGVIPMSIVGYRYTKRHT